MYVAVPDIEEDIPFPFTVGDALPELAPGEELNVRARTVKFLADMQGKSITPDVIEQQEAEMLARQMVADPKYRPDYTKYPNQTMAYLAGLVAQSNCMIVDELADLKLYVVNNLVRLHEEAKDGKTKIMALKALGEVDGVDAFKKRSEMTVVHKPIEEVEKELLTILDGVSYSVVEDGEVMDGADGMNSAEEVDFDEEIDKNDDDEADPV